MREAEVCLKYDRCIPQMPAMTSCKKTTEARLAADLAAVILRDAKSLAGSRQTYIQTACQVPQNNQDGVHE